MAKNKGEKVMPRLSKITMVQYVLLVVFIILVIRIVQKIILYFKLKKILMRDRLVEKPRTNEKLRVNESNGQNQFEPDRAVLVNPLSGESVMIKSPCFKVGKNLENDLQIQDSVISRMHAQIIWNAGEYFIQDQGSLNGTFLNGKEIGRTCVKLTSNDRIMFANIELTFLMRE